MPRFAKKIRCSALGFRPAVPGVGIGDEGDGEAACPLHLLGQDLFHLRLLGLGALDDEFVVDLQDQLGLQALGLAAGRRTRIMASFMMSAAVPWMGMFSATRSPKARRLKLEEFSSGSQRRRPMSVET